MKKLLISTSIAALMASNSLVSFAGSVPDAIQFTAGTKAVAADVNTNFNNITPAVNDNNDRIGQNEIDIAANTAAIGGAGGCPTGEMVAVGPLCVDIYEASVWDAATDGAQIDTSINPLTRCATDGSNCGKDSADAANTAIYARSVKTVGGVFPNARVSWYQATQACANVGKRLPTTAEWQMAASGTPSGTNTADDPTDTCNVGAITKGIAETGASSAGTTPCKSSAGAFDMVGNLWEWSAELTDLAVSTGTFNFSDIDTATARMLGSAFASGSTTPNTQSVATLDQGPSYTTNGQLGFRCVK